MNFLLILWVIVGKLIMLHQSLTNDLCQKDDMWDVNKPISNVLELYSCQLVWNAQNLKKNCTKTH